MFRFENAALSRTSRQDIASRHRLRKLHLETPVGQISDSAGPATLCPCQPVFTNFSYKGCSPLVCHQPAMRFVEWLKTKPNMLTYSNNTSLWLEIIERTTNLMILNDIKSVLVDPCWGSNNLLATFHVHIQIIPKKNSSFLDSDLATSVAPKRQLNSSEQVGNLDESTLKKGTEVNEKNKPTMII